MTLSYPTILGILGAGELAHGLIYLFSGLPIIPHDLIRAGLFMLGLAMSISGLCGWLGRKSHACH
jgi:hypothetical protein